ncbi:soluble quino protein glucose dehydrogenase [Xylaria sp. CBS 124048]|nr:soluble quino protein glucose dehydrogenase [Xylaria sp. CBS 124048]
MHSHLSAAIGVVLTGNVLAQTSLPFPTSCAGVSGIQYPYTIDSAWQVTKIASGLTSPRTVTFDSVGNLLVLEALKGVSVHTFGSDGCINSTATVVSNTGLNHGLSLTPDGKTLYASSPTEVWSWTYDAATRQASDQKIIVNIKQQTDHATRTIAVSPTNPDIIVVSCGSNDNWDYASGDASVGRAVVKAFDVTESPEGGYTYDADGILVAYGVRNEVALTFDPNGHAWGVENSGDEFTRTVDGASVDIHNGDPAEELNYFGDPENPRSPNWFGYPTCFTVWDPSLFNDTTALKTGSQFVVAPNATFNDASCTGISNPPRLGFQSHVAPINAAFDKDATNLYVTFHGSWNRAPASGYQLVEVPFTKTADGIYDPVAPANSTTGYSIIMSAQDTGSCSMFSCWRLAGVSWDKAGEKLFISSENTGEAFVLRKN